MKGVTFFPTPVVDGYLLEDNCIDLLKNGKVPDVPVLLGCNGDDDRERVPADASVESIREEATKLYGKHAEAYLKLTHADSVEGYREAVKDKSNFLLTVLCWSKLQSELGRKAPYLYYFNQEIPASDRGTFHLAEIPYVFQTLSRLWASV